MPIPLRNDLPVKEIEGASDFSELLIEISTASIIVMVLLLILKVIGPKLFPAINNLFKKLFKK